MTRITVPRFLLVLVAFIGGLWLIEQVFSIVYRMADVLLLFGLAWLLKLLLDPLIRRLEASRVPRGAAIAIAYLLAVGGLVGAILALAPQFPALTQNFPRLVDEVSIRSERGAIWLQQHGVQIDPQALTNQIASLATEFGRTVAGRAVAAAQSLLGLLGRIALVITVSIYMSLTRGRMSNVVRPVVPPRWRDEFDAFVDEVNSAYSSYIRGYFYVAALGTLMSAVLLFGFRVPGAVVWLMLVFVLRLLPFIGGTLADLLLVLVFFFQLRFASSIVATVLVIAGQVVLTNILMPRVMSRELGINPLLVLFAVLLGGKIYGVAGILFAIPAAAVIATVTGKALNRYLLPAYERPGWWRDDVTVAESSTADAPAASVERLGVAKGRPPAPPVEPNVPRVKEPL
jgi:predicted PurR-regulated permease PerM